jgi:pimeloyl-ACP methyl ester carboxylesterase
MKKIILIVWGSFILNGLSYGQGKDTVSKFTDANIYSHVKGNGKPVVIFVSGLGEDHSGWQNIQDTISNSTLTVSYDRSGLGKSEYRGEKKDLHAMAMELKLLVQVHKISKPVILVGHSLGCQIIKKYASLYPENVRGIIFLDPGYDERKLRARLDDSVWLKREQTLRKYLPEFNAAQQAEADNLNTNCELADQITSLPQVPILLFTATRINAGFPGSSIELKVKQETHLLWLRSLPWAKHIEVKGARHYIQNETPDIVIDAVNKMIQSIQVELK